MILRRRAPVSRIASPAAEEESAMRHGIAYVAAVVGCAALLLPLTAAPAPLARSVRSPKVAAARKNRNKLQGTWYTVSIACRAWATGPDKGDTITYEGDRYVQRLNGRVYQAGTFTIVDATASPKQIEYHCTEGALKGAHFRSIYTLDGDEHQLCSDDANDNRPKELSGKAGFLRVTKRQPD
jgi:uncharacterized protein (TIGR03067 family)